VRPAFIRIRPGDNVATALRDVAAGEVWEGIAVLQPIPFGHKIALVPIEAGGLVLKYGEPIGAATALIRPGEHLHVHNLEGLRGRGDRA
jgi:altronate dehydratase small subunit